MLLPNSGLENHPDGLGNVNSVVNANWEILDAWANPASGFTASRAGFTVTAAGGPAGDGKIFTSDNIGDKIRFANGVVATITATAGVPGTPVTTCTVATSGTVTGQAFNLYAPVTETPYTLFARAFNKVTKVADIPNGYTMIWSSALKRFVPTTTVLTEPNSFLNTATALISNSAAEATILGRGAGAASIPGNSVAGGTVIEFLLTGTIKTTAATPSLRLRVKLGGTTYADETDPNLPQFTDLHFELSGYVKLTGALAAMTARVQAVARIAAATTAGTERTIHIPSINTGTTIDMTSARTLDITAQFGTAAANNVLTIYSARIKQFTNPN